MEKATFTLGNRDIEFNLNNVLVWTAKSRIPSGGFGLPFKINFLHNDSERAKIRKAALKIPENPNDPQKRQREIEKLKRNYYTWLEQRLCSRDTSCPFKKAGLCSGINTRVGEAKLSTWFNILDKFPGGQNSLNTLLENEDAYCYNIRK